MPRILLILVMNIKHMMCLRECQRGIQNDIFSNYGIVLLSAAEAFLLMSACVLVAERRSGGAHFSQRLGCGTASTSGILSLYINIYACMCVYVCMCVCFVVSVCYMPVATADISGEPNSLYLHGI